MGCDIHTYIEFRHRKEHPWADGRWFSWGDGENYLGRDYPLFAALSGMRKDIGFEELIPARGMPDDPGSSSFQATHCMIVEDKGYDPDRWRTFKHVVRSQVHPNVPVVKRGDAEFARYLGIYHGHSFLTQGEIHRCLAHAGLKLEKTMFFFQVVMTTMEKLNEVYETRLVFWYDF